MFSHSANQNLFEPFIPQIFHLYSSDGDWCLSLDPAKDDLQTAIELSLQESQQAQAEERELHRYPTIQQP